VTAVTGMANGNARELGGVLSITLLPPRVRQSVCAPAQNEKWRTLRGQLAVQGLGGHGVRIDSTPLVQLVGALINPTRVEARSLVLIFHSLEQRGDRGEEVRNLGRLLLARDERRNEQRLDVHLDGKPIELDAQRIE
jgi:hypothetical protein